MIFFFFYLEMPQNNIFLINQYITLSLQGNQTITYVMGEEFLQCRYLFLKKISDNFQNQISSVIHDLSITSIDEQEQNVDNSMEGAFKIEKFNITPQEEFWAHCSNLQVWAESGYDSRLLHRNLAFPLLKRLVDVGDSLAKEKFREEIANRFERGYLPVILYLLTEGYLDYLSDEYYIGLSKDKPQFFSEILFKSVESKKFIKGYLLSLYLFNKLYPYLDQEIIDKFICVMKQDKENVERILFSPNMLTPAPGVSINPAKLYYIRLAIILDMLNKRDFKQFLLSELDLYIYLEDYLDYYDLKDEGDFIRGKSRS